MLVVRTSDALTWSKIQNTRKNFEEVHRELDGEKCEQGRLDEGSAKILLDDIAP